MSGVHDITWFRVDQPVPKLKFVSGLPENAAEIFVAWEILFIGGPKDAEVIVNDDPLPPYTVFIDERRRDQFHNSHDQELKKFDPATYIARLPYRRHIYALVDYEGGDDIDGGLSYLYMGWWSPI